MTNPKKYSPVQYFCEPSGSSAASLTALGRQLQLAEGRKFAAAVPVAAPAHAAFPLDESEGG